MLRGAFGKLFSKLKKMPVPVRLKEMTKKKSREDYIQNLKNKVYFVRGKGPVYVSPAARLSLGVKKCVKNLMNFVYELVPQILVQSPKNSTVMKVCVMTEDSKALPIFVNDFIPDESKPEDQQ